MQHIPMVVLHYSKTDGMVKKPYGQGYPTHPKTLGDYMRRRRMELRMLQKDVASFVGVSEDTITFWENNRTDPTAKYVSKIIQFIGIVPPIFPNTFAGQVKAYRYVRGMTHAQLGSLIGVNGSTVSAWEAGYLPHPENELMVKKLIADY